jgi:hypothetical protein
MKNDLNNLTNFEGLTGTAIALFLVLERLDATKDQPFYESRKHLAKFLNCTLLTIARAEASLEKKGLISVIRRKGEPSLLYVNCPETLEQAAERLEREQLPNPSIVEAFKNGLLTENSTFADLHQLMATGQVAI